jgi:hypothetical protein
MSRRVKINRRKASVVDVVSTAFEMITELAEEIREVYDNAPESLQNGPRLTTLNDSADILENVNEPDVPDELADIEVEYGEWSARRMSRATRRDYAVQLMDDVIQTLQARLDSDEPADSEILDGAQELIDGLDEVKGDIDCAEFPGMYG